MPNLFRTLDGAERSPSQSPNKPPLQFQLPDGEMIEGIWAGSAMGEKLSWWLGKSGHQLVQSEPVASIAVKADDDGEIIWGDAPAGSRLMFVLEPAPPGKGYRLAKMVTTAATPAQVAYFRHERSALFGTLQADGSIHRIPPPEPPQPRGPVQRELF